MNGAIKIPKKAVDAWFINENGVAWTCFEYKGDVYRTNLRGKHQAYNCAHIIEQMRAQGKSRAEIDRHLANIPLDGRFETVLKKPLVIFDRLESAEDVKNLVRAIDDYFGREMQKAQSSRTNLHPRPFKKLIIFDFDKGLGELSYIKQNVTLIFTSEAMRRAYLETYSGVTKTYVMDLEKAISHAVQNFPEHKIFVVGGVLTFEVVKSTLCV